MAFDGTWKVDRNENYEKFMEVMGKSYISRAISKSNTTVAEYKLELPVNDLWVAWPFAVCYSALAQHAAFNFKRFRRRGERYWKMFWF